MATYGSNSLAVRFQRNEIPEPLPANKSQEMPPAGPQMGSFMPGETPRPGQDGTKEPALA